MLGRTHKPVALPPSARRRCLRLRLVGKNAEVFRCNSQKCTIPGKRYSPAGAVFLSLALSTIFLHYKRIVEFQTPMLIQIHILSNSRPWVWGLLFFWRRGIIEHLHHNRDGQKKGKDFSIHGVKPPFWFRAYHTWNGNDYALFLWYSRYIMGINMTDSVRYSGILTSKVRKTLPKMVRILKEPRFW